VAQKFHFAILRIEVTRASRGLSAITELLVTYLETGMNALWKYAVYLFFTCGVYMTSLSRSWHWWAPTATAACVARLGAVADWWCSWPLACVLVFMPMVDILDIPCDCQFVFSVLDELRVSHRAWFSG